MLGTAKEVKGLAQSWPRERGEEVKKKCKAKAIEMACDDCGDSWLYFPQAKKCHLCGGPLTRRERGGK